MHREGSRLLVSSRIAECVRRRRPHSWKPIQTKQDYRLFSRARLVLSFGECVGAWAPPLPPPLLSSPSPYLRARTPRGVRAPADEGRGGEKRRGQAPGTGLCWRRRCSLSSSARSVSGVGARLRACRSRASLTGAMPSSVWLRVWCGRVYCLLRMLLERGGVCCVRLLCVRCG